MNYLNSSALQQNQEMEQTTHPSPPVPASQDVSPLPHTDTQVAQGTPVVANDDGSLAALCIPRDENSRSFNCDVIQQSRLVNTTFYIIDFIENVPTRYSKQKGTHGQTLVLILFSLDDPMSKARKFFTGSADILYVCRYVKKLNAFPRRVTMRSLGNRYFFE